MFNKPFFIYFLKVQVIKRIILFFKGSFFYLVSQRGVLSWPASSASKESELVQPPS